MIETIIKNIASNIKQQEELQVSEICKIIPVFCKEVGNIIKANEIEISKKKKRFNIFNCLTKHHLEELHTNFIIYLLNINEEHDLKAEFLLLFVETLKETVPELNSVFLKELHYDKHFYIKKNHFIGRSYDNEDEYGFIDIYIETKNYVFCIENKITAYEQPKQISRYAKYCAKQKDKTSIVLFLNPWGYLSSQSGKEKYYSISYFDTILTWINKSISFAESENLSIVANGLEFYKKVIVNKILNISTTENMKEIKKILLSETNLTILKYWSDISTSVNELHKDLRKKFMSEIGHKLSKLYSIEKNEEIITIANPDLQYKKGKDNIIFQIDENENGLFYGLFPTLSERTANSKDFLKFKERFQDSLETEEDNDGWILWKWFKERYSDEFYYSLATNLENMVDELISEIKIYLDIWKKEIVEMK
jgi:hypothetical protein